jgi:hypothetical protein
MGTPDMRPDLSGILITLYPPNEGSSAPFNASIHITNPALAGNVDDPTSRLAFMLAQLIDRGCGEIRIVLSTPPKPGNPILLFKGGEVYAGILIPADKGDYEGLNFACQDEPIGQYITADPSSLPSTPK